MTIDPGEQQRLDRLGAFIRLDAVITAGALAFILAIYFFVRQNNWLLVAASMAAAAGAMMATGLRPLSRGNATQALWWLVTANWAIAIGASLVATFAWPICTLAALLPVVIAVPYVSRRQFRWMIIGAVLVGTAAACLGLLQDFSGLTADVPTWSTNAVLIVFCPFMAVLLTQAGAQMAETLRDSLDLSLQANRDLQDSEQLLADQAELLRESRTRIVAAADEERRRIERDLHDGAQQRLVGLSLQISIAKEQAAADPAGAQSTLDRIRDEVRHAQEEMRGLVQGLYPPVLTQHGVGPAVRAVVGQINNPVRTRVDDVERLHPDREASLYFLCLEALQNVSKHAGPAVGVSVTVAEAADVVRIEITDDGPGFDVDAAGTGAGLVNMADRIGSAGGELTIESTPGSGTRVAATMPKR